MSDSRTGFPVTFTTGTSGITTATSAALSSTSTSASMDMDVLPDPESSVPPSLPPDVHQVRSHFDQEHQHAVEVILDLWLELFCLEDGGEYFKSADWRKKVSSDRMLSQAIRQYLHNLTAEPEVIALYDSRFPPAVVPEPMHLSTASSSTIGPGVTAVSNLMNLAASGSSSLPSVLSLNPPASSLPHLSSDPGISIGTSDALTASTTPSSGPITGPAVTGPTHPVPHSPHHSSSVQISPCTPNHQQQQQQRLTPSQRYAAAAGGAATSATVGSVSSAGAADSIGSTSSLTMTSIPSVSPAHGRPPPLHRVTQKAQRSAAKVSNTSTPSSSPRTPSQHHQQLLLMPASAGGTGTITGAAAYASRTHATRQQSISAVYETSIGSQEQIVEKAKQEAHVMQRIDQLRREGLWMPKRLPKCADPPREKAHWDYLLEEMTWLATDFAQERKWKKNAAKKCAQMVMKYHRDKEAAKEKEKRDEMTRVRRLASAIAKVVRNFWSDVEKLAEHKQNSIIERKRKHARDAHLNFIVLQTEQYTSRLTEGLGKNQRSSVSGRKTTSTTAGTDDDDDEGQELILCTDCDDDFKPGNVDDEIDDEETIAREEEEDDVTGGHDAELNDLERGMHAPLEDLIPAGYPVCLPPNVTSSDASKRRSVKRKRCDLRREEESTAGAAAEDDVHDSEFTVADGVEEEDDEKTIAAQEAKESVNYSEEIKELEADEKLTREQLIEKYYSGYTGGEPLPDSEDQSSADDEDEEDDHNEGIDTATESQEEQMDEDEDLTEEDESQIPDDDIEDEEIGLEFLTNPLIESPSKSTIDIEDMETAAKSLTEGTTTGNSPSKKGPSRAITDIAAAVEEIQPKGNTLSTTIVKTVVPSLLKHPLREYQHIGLDWLVAMYEKKLNGILADEMGLGKTIQTIALLAHLACDKGIWGPHLIVVPTSVMLNWEMEFKKWCPGFKVMTYYGSQKERKVKRQGWTKANQFHVCITSYKLVIQDHSSFRRKKWRYLILDEAQHIKNFKSQRWQMLLNFNTSRRLLLTGTPLQNNLMELWSLMHFLMPNIFASHRDFKDWFVNPVTGMIEGNQDYNEELVTRLHKILRPFLLRRLKKDVEKQLPQKHEHVILCDLSKRQRFLYEEFMSLTKTRETLASGNFLSVINVLMQLRKVCNHPNLFETRPIVSPFAMTGITYETASLATKPLTYDPLAHVSLDSLNFDLVKNSLSLSAFAYERIRTFTVPSELIEEIDSVPEPAPRMPRGLLKLNFVTPKGNSDSLLSNRSLTVTPSPAVVASRSTSAQDHEVGDGGDSDQHSNHQTELLETMSVEPEAKRRRTDSTSLVDSSLISAANAGKGGDGSFQSIVTISNIGAQLSPSATPLMRISSIQSQATGATADVLQRKTIGKLLIGPSGHEHLAINHKQPSLAPAADHVKSTEMAGSSSERTEDFIRSAFEIGELERVRAEERRQKLRSLAQINERRCSAVPLYPTDLMDIFTLNQLPGDVVTESLTAVPSDFNIGQGLFHCRHKSTNQRNGRIFFDHTDALMRAIRSPAELVSHQEDVLKRFVFNVPPAAAPRIRMHVSHPDPSGSLSEQVLEHEMQSEFSERTELLHTIVTNTRAQFPEARLIQYDCGKLQTLDRLLWDLKSGSHRVLIFTQMSKMLDIFEQFLNYHGHTYLRLDGATRIEQRQALMERFNADRKIFCFILSTRSGGVGVNLTGADTVIFYDSDWNPTMDAQAQDRCHRIGQTRDVHIYRLISERTVEENILKKAQQKKLLGDLAIEEGNFTTAFFKQNAVRDLFGEGMSGAGHGLRDMLESQDSRSNAPSPVVLFSSSCVAATTSGTEIGGDSAPALQEWEKAIERVEEREDIVAAKSSKAEANAEFAEFDENVPLDVTGTGDAAAAAAADEDEELERLVEELTPIERYALTFLESTLDHQQQLKQAEAEIELHKKDWEQEHMKSLKEEQERSSDAASGSDGDDMLTMSRETATNNQALLTPDGQYDGTMAWAPPTPPQDHDEDMHVDFSVAYLYSMEPMMESELPPVYVPREPAVKRFRLDHPSASPRIRQKAKKEEIISFPRSLFDRPSAAVLKLRRELKALRMRGQLIGGPDTLLIQKIMSILGPNQTLPTPLTLLAQLQSMKQPHAMLQGLQADAHVPWNILDEWLILQVIQQIQELPTNLVIVSPASTPNWDMISDAVSCTTHNFRSSRICRHRYEQVVIPREEGRQPPVTPIDSPAGVSGGVSPVTPGTASVGGATPSKKKQKKAQQQQQQQQQLQQQQQQQQQALNGTTGAAMTGAASAASTPPKAKIHKTKILFTSDDHSGFTSSCNNRITVISDLARKRRSVKDPMVRPVFERMGGMTTPASGAVSAAAASHLLAGKVNAKHIEMFQQSGIAYEIPVSPAVIATNRIDRMTKEKTAKLANAQAEAQARQKAAVQLQIQKQNQMKAQIQQHNQVQAMAQQQQQQQKQVVVQQQQQSQQQQQQAQIQLQPQFVTSVSQPQQQYVVPVPQVARTQQQQKLFPAQIQQLVQQQQQQQPVLQVQSQVTVGQRVAQAFSPGSAAVAAAVVATGSATVAPVTGLASGTAHIRPSTPLSSSTAPSAAIGPPAVVAGVGIVSPALAATASSSSSSVSSNPEMDKVQQLAKGLMADADNFIAQKQQQQKQAQQQAAAAAQQHKQQQQQQLVVQQQQQQPQTHQVQLLRTAGGNQIITGPNFVPGTVYNVNMNGQIVRATAAAPIVSQQQSMTTISLSTGATVGTAAAGGTGAGSVRMPMVSSLPQTSYGKGQTKPQFRLIPQSPQRIMHIPAVVSTSGLTSTAVTVTTPALQSAIAAQQQQQQTQQIVVQQQQQPQQTQQPQQPQTQPVQLLRGVSGNQITGPNFVPGTVYNVSVGGQIVRATAAAAQAVAQPQQQQQQQSVAVPTASASGGLAGAATAGPNVRMPMLTTLAPNTMALVRSLPPAAYGRGQVKPQFRFITQSPQRILQFAGIPHTVTSAAGVSTAGLTAVTVTTSALQSAVAAQQAAQQQQQQPQVSLQKLPQVTTLSPIPGTSVQQQQSPAVRNITHVIQSEKEAEKK